MLKGSFNKLLVSVEEVKGIGPATAAKLRSRRIDTMEDALLFLPTRYQDRSRVTPVRELEIGAEAVVQGRITKISRGRPGPRRMLSLALEDGTGSLAASWFGLPGFNRFEKDQEIVLFGRVDEYKGKASMVHPEVIADPEDESQTGRFVPVYRAIPGFSSKQFRKLVGTILDKELDGVKNPLSPALIEAEGLLDLSQAFRRVHFPQEEEDASLTGKPRRSLIFTELFLFQVGLALSRRERKAQKAVPIPGLDRVGGSVEAMLPFELTKAQARVLEELGRDLSGSRPMNRLLQGDVGSGKTLVAAVPLLAAALAGRQAVLMAPTELLARQHLAELSALAAPLSLEVELLTGSLDRKRSAACLEGLAQGRVRLVVGTQALIQRGVRFKDLGLAVIDEQHRFGVYQRAGLAAKGRGVHLLALTATPIPRSLALTAYGDLDLSILDEKPRGRQEPVTRLLPPERIGRAWRAIKGAVGQGLQAYVVLPAVEPGRGLVSAEERYADLTKKFPELKVGLVHGRLDREEQARSMEQFASGELDVLVSTTVVEVGLDVPRAAVMVVENAERFGLAQIHQLRGRIGRGGSKAACLLISSDRGPGRERLKILESTADGFVIAEEDLHFRGPGDLIGTRQAGWPEFRIADLINDPGLLERARRAAFELVDRDSGLTASENRVLAGIVARRLRRRLQLSRSD